MKLRLAGLFMFALVLLSGGCSTIDDDIDPYSPDGLDAAVYDVDALPRE